MQVQKKRKITFLFKWNLAFDAILIFLVFHLIFSIFKQNYYDV